MDGERFGVFGLGFNCRWSCVRILYGVGVRRIFLELVVW